MKRHMWFLLVLPLLACEPQQQSASDSGTAPIVYSVNFDNVQHHELRISIHFKELKNGPIKLRMPQTSPGRYAVHNFAKNVYESKAVDGSGNELALRKTNITEWEVSGHSGEVVFSYTLFGNHGDGTYTGIDNRKAHMNMPATFIYGEGLDDRPIEVIFDLEGKDNWDVATQLVAAGDNKYTAPNYYYFYDSPTMVGPMRWRRWQVEDDGEEYTIEIAAMVEDTDEALDDYTEWVKQVVEEQIKIYGGLPKFDYGRYTFLVSYNPWINGDGMEHRNSTVCSSSGSLANNAGGLINTISHEFFHAWNVERIRPQSLEPFDFDHANMSDALWFAEGFTSYYDDLVLRRAGIRDQARYARGIAGGLNYVINFPGREIKGPIEMSKHAPFVDAGTANDETNYQNTFISYYSYGAVIGLAMDLSIRSSYEGKSLDDLMTYMWENHGKNEKPYTIGDIENALASVTGDVEFASAFFEDYIYGSDLPDIPALLKQFGVTMRLRNPNKAGFPSFALTDKDGDIIVRNTMLRSNPLYESGLEQGDKILEVDGQPLTSAADFDRDWEIGSSHTIKYVQNGLEHAGTFTIIQDPSFEVMLAEDAGSTPSEEQLARRNAWLGEDK